MKERNDAPDVSRKSTHGPVEKPIRSILPIDMREYLDARTYAYYKRIQKRSRGQIIPMEKHRLAFIPQRDDGVYPLSDAISIQEAIRKGLIVVLSE